MSVITKIIRTHAKQRHTKSNKIMPVSEDNDRRTSRSLSYVGTGGADAARRITACVMVDKHETYAVESSARELIRMHLQPLKQGQLPLTRNDCQADCCKRSPKMQYYENDSIQFTKAAHLDHTERAIEQIRCACAGSVITEVTGLDVRDEIF